MNGYGFTDGVVAVFTAANADASRRGHAHVSTDHFLCALLQVTDGVTPTVLRNLHVDVARMTRDVSSRLAGVGEAVHLVGSSATLSASAQKVVELAMAEARHFGHDYIGTEHLLLALLRDGAGSAAEILTLAGASLDAVRAKVAGDVTPSVLADATTTRPERAVPVLPVDDLKVAKQFYVDGLGFEVAFEATDDGAVGLMGVRRGAMAITLDCPMAGHGRDACVALEVDSADRYYDEWHTRVAVKRPPKDEEWGARTFDLEDPFGNTIFVIGPPARLS